MRIVGKRILIGACLAAAVLVAATLGAARAAVAAEPSPAAFLDRLADALGLPRDRVEAAMKQAALGALEDAVRAGRVSAERAERIRQRIEQGRLWLGPHLGRGHGPWGRHAALGVIEPVARLLGLTPRQLLDELRQGKTLAQVAAAHGKSRDEVKEALRAAARQRLDRAVAAGRLTPEQAQARLQALEERLDALLDRSWPAKAPHGQRPGGTGSGT